MTLPVVTQSGPAQQLYVAGFSILQLLSLVLLASHTAYNVRATPIWGCEAPSLPDGAVHVVVSTFNAEADQLLPWIWHLGLTNAHIYIYYRVNDPAIPPRFKKVTLPCGMALLPTLLLPNKGREAASFLQHIITHYSNLPKAMMLVHDHGPASRHSLCGPFYRRVRGYYRGLVEQHASSARTTRKQLALPSAARDGSAVASRGSNGSTTGNTGSVFSRFASMAVTLSSGCMENWAKGCCAMYICSGTVSSCPFTTETCTSNLPGRTFYLHTRPALYDSRYENQIIGYNGSNFPVSMVRYASTSSAFSSMWNISHEYPDGEMEHSKAHTLQALKDILSRYGFASKKLTNFKSCCASLIIRDTGIARWPLKLYREILTYAMDKRMHYEATKAVAGPGWALWSESDYTKEDLLLYMRVDLKLQSMQGCPSRVPAVQAVLRQLEAEALVQREAGSGRGIGGIGKGTAQDGSGGRGVEPAVKATLSAKSSTSSSKARKARARRAAMASGPSPVHPTADTTGYGSGSISRDTASGPFPAHASGSVSSSSRDGSGSSQDGSSSGVNGEADVGRSGKEGVDGHSGRVVGEGGGNGDARISSLKLGLALAWPLGICCGFALAALRGRQHHQQQQ